MTINVAVLPEQPGTNLPVPRTAAASVVSVASVNDGAAFNRQQLPSSIPAPAQLAAYAAYLPQAYKPVIRAPSSALAAQFIAQEVGGDETLSIFEPPVTAAPPATNVDDTEYLNIMRQARGEAPVMSKQAAQVNARTEQRAAQQEDIRVNVPALLRDDMPARSTVAGFAAALPVVLSQFMRKPSLANTRGFGAYQLAAARSASIRPSAVN